MNASAATFFSAFFCVFSRAFLGLFDRVIFSQRQIDFSSALFWNAVYPFIVAFFFCVLSGQLDAKVFELFCQPVSLWNGLAAQLTAASFSLGLRVMPIRSVVFSAKVADFFIPAACFLLSQEISSAAVIFNQATTIAFLPLGYAVIKQRSIKFRASFFMIGCLLLQAILSTTFRTSHLTTTYEEFVRLMVCILGWRICFASVPFLFSRLKLEKENPSLSSLGAFFLRGLLAYLSQASFFFCILFDNSLMAWPILNTGPLIACCVAALFLKEEIGAAERKIAFILGFIFVCYILFYWRNL